MTIRNPLAKYMRGLRRPEPYTPAQRRAVEAGKVTL